MPELPEVEAARRILEEHCVGREITLVDAADDESERDIKTESTLTSRLYRDPQLPG
jgi:formamidopyrimidine-DNA glycosylase